jgi:RimJ/RimL family protein N-acetyltransferase
MKIPTHAIVHSNRLTLRLLEHNDLHDLLEVHASDEVTRYLPFDAWTSMVDAKTWYQRTMLRHGEGSAMQFVMQHRDEGRVIGTALLFHFEEESRRAEIGYVLGRPYWGKGFAHEGVGALLEFAFEDLNLRRLEAEIDPHNVASGEVLRKLGFTQEGLLRERWSLKGRISDSALYGLLRHDWEAARFTR